MPEPNSKQNLPINTVLKHALQDLLFIYLGYLDRLAHFSFKASWTTPDHNTGSNALYSFQGGHRFLSVPANQHWEDTGDEAYHSSSLSKKDKNV